VPGVHCTVLCAVPGGAVYCAVLCAVPCCVPVVHLGRCGPLQRLGGGKLVLTSQAASVPVARWPGGDQGGDPRAARDPCGPQQVPPWPSLLLMGRRDYRRLPGSD
jgi:hypothetical protein